MNGFFKKIIGLVIIAGLCFGAGYLINMYVPQIDMMMAGGVLFVCYIGYWLLNLDKKKSKDVVTSGKGKTQDGKELRQYSDSRWVTEKELMTEKKFRYHLFRDLKRCKDDGIVIRSDLRGNSLHVNMYKPIHTLVIGTTGSGKTEGFINPSIQILSSCASKPCLVITDPKGELYNKNARKLTEEGYEIKVLDLRNPYASTRWNPMDNAFLAYQRAHNLQNEVEMFRGTNPANTKYKPISKEYTSEWYGFNGIAYPTIDLLKSDLSAKAAELRDLAENELHEIAMTLCPIQSKNDPTWERGAQDFIWGVMLAMLEDSLDPELDMTREKFNLYNVSKICALKDNDGEDPYYTLKNYFIGRAPTSKVPSLVSTAINNAPKTTMSYMGIVTSSLSLFQDSGMCFATSENEMNFDDFTDKPTALIIKVPDEKESRHAIATMCILQMYKKLIDRANQTEKLELPRNVYFLLDEFANLPKIDKFDSLITVGRSRKIFFSLVVQSYSQLDTKYGEDVSKTIRGNCNIQIYIGSDDTKTKEEFSKLCGDVSIELEKKSTSSGKGDDKQTSTSKDTVSRPLIYPDELGHIPHESAIVKIYNEYPIKVKLSFSYKCPMFTMQPLPAKYVPSRALDENKVRYDVAKRNSKKLRSSFDF